MSEQSHIDVVYEGIIETLRPPDLMIYLQASVRTVRHRIRKRGRPEEQDLGETEDLRKRVVQPQPGRRATEQVVMFSETPPDFPVVGFHPPATVIDAELSEADSLAVQHPEQVVIGLYQQFCRVRERLVPGKPGDIRVTVGADDRQVGRFRVKTPGYGTHRGLNREQAIGVQAQAFSNLNSLRS